MWDPINGEQPVYTDALSNQIDPFISGDRIVWVDDRNGNWDIYMIEISKTLKSDFNNDGIVNLLDLGFMANQWLDTEEWY